MDFIKVNANQYQASDDFSDAESIGIVRQVRQKRDQDGNEYEESVYDDNSDASSVNPIMFNMKQRMQQMVQEQLQKIQFDGQSSNDESEF